MRTIDRSTQFKKDYKNAAKSIYSSELDSRLSEVIGYLALDSQPPPRFRDHQLKADWKGYRDCHVFPGLALIYQLTVTARKDDAAAADQADKAMVAVPMSSACDGGLIQTTSV